MSNYEQAAGASDNNEAWDMQAPEEEKPAETIDIDASKVGDAPTAEAAPVINEYRLPDGTTIRGTVDDFRQAMDDYNDRVRAI